MAGTAGASTTSRPCSRTSASSAVRSLAWNSPRLAGSSNLSSTVTRARGPGARSPVAARTDAAGGPAAADRAASLQRLRLQRRRRGVRDLQRFAVGADLAAVLALRQHSARLAVEHLELELVAAALFIDGGAQQEAPRRWRAPRRQTSGRRAAFGWQRGGARRQRHDLATRREQAFAQRLCNALAESGVRRLAGDRQHQDLGPFGVRDAAREQERPPKSSRPEFDHAAHGPFGSPQSQDSPFILPSSVVVNGGRAGSDPGGSGAGPCVEQRRPCLASGLRLAAAALFLADRDLPRLHFRLLRNDHLQHAVLQLGPHVLGVGAVGKRERAAEAAVRAFVRVVRCRLVRAFPVRASRKSSDGFRSARCPDRPPSRRVGRRGIRSRPCSPSRRSWERTARSHRRRGFQLAERIPAQHVAHHAKRIPN